MLLPGSPRVPPQDPHASQHQHGWEQAGWCCLAVGNGEVGELVSENQNPQGTHYHWKTPDPPPHHPLAKIWAEGAGWGASPGHPASSWVPALRFMVLRAASVAWSILQRAAFGHRSHPNLPRDSEMRNSAAPRSGFWGDPKGMGAARGSLRLQPWEGSGHGGNSRAGSTPRLCPGKDTVAGTSPEGDLF